MESAKELIDLLDHRLTLEAVQGLDASDLEKLHELIRYRV